MEMISMPPAGWVRYEESFLSREAADHLSSELRDSLDWRLYQIKLFGREIPQPRLTAFYGEAGVKYEYSGLTLKATPWGGGLHELALRVCALSGTSFNSVLCNLYRDGQDSMGWHADDEAVLGRNPIIASVSFGATRRFDLRPKRGVAGEKRSIALEHGSLLLMGGDLQHHWQHQIAKTKRVNEPRINLTFRQILE